MIPTGQPIGRTAAEVAEWDAAIEQARASGGFRYSVAYVAVSGRTPA